MSTVYKLPQILRIFLIRMKSQNLLKKKIFVDLAGLFPKFCLMIQKNKNK